MGKRVFRVGAIVLSIALAITSLASGSPTTIEMAAVGSAEQVYVTSLAPGAEMSLITPQGQTLYTQKANALGGVLFRKVPPGKGYVVQDADGNRSRPLIVHDDVPAPWNPDIYQQPINPNGYGYITTRDGTKLAYTVHPPTSPALQVHPPTNPAVQVEGVSPGLPPGTVLPNLPAPAPYLPPYPTLIEYSGYGYANPAGPESGIAILANLMGYAVVDVTMRGIACSGGAFDFFEPLQNLDGYDVIETIASQPWVLGNRVGMMGISYGGISQLFTAQLNPPHLAAISPLSVIDATATTLYPGGILNTGFAVEWAKERQHAAQVAGPKTGQEWAWQRMQEGDATCIANQALHPEAADLQKRIRENDHYVPSEADPVDPVTFVHKIKVPTFMACQWQDEQTGGHCPELVQHFTGTDKKWFTFTNGAHIDSLDPETYNRWYDFLELYVARRAPMLNQALSKAATPVIYQAAMGLPQTEVVTLPVDHIQQIPTYDLALAAFERLPQIRVLFENGAGTSPTGSTTPGNPYPGFEASFDQYPIPWASAQQWYFGPQGTLSDNLPASAGIDEYTSDAKALPLTNFKGGTGGGGLWGNASQWEWNWKPNPPGKALSYVTAPLKADTTVIGAGAVYARVRSSTPNVDLQATISEVRPDGNETFVQNGYLRASWRELSPDSNNIFKKVSTLLDPIPSGRAADFAPLPSDEFVNVAIPLYHQGHVYRAGSRIRLTIAAPNGAQPVWSFSQTLPAGTATVAIAYSPARPSYLVLPVIPGFRVPTELPPCPSLRSQPCRPYVPLVNRRGS